MIGRLYKSAKIRDGPSKISSELISVIADVNFIVWFLLPNINLICDEMSEAVMSIIT